MENTFFVLAIFLYHGVVFTESGFTNSHAEITQFIMDYGYAVEVHEVITEDGYILGIHRITGQINKKSNGPKKEKVALLMHGLIGSSATWVVTGPDRSMAFILVDRGYDVWLGNNRGNTYSSKHVSKSVISHEFWDFSHHELGIYDLPATIDYVLSKTNKTKLHLVCFSQGCTETFVMGSLKPEYNKKLKFVVALAPAVYMGHLRGAADIIAQYNNIFVGFTEKVGYFPVFWSSLRTLIIHFCKSGKRFHDICILVIFTVAGPGYDEFNQEAYDRLLRFEPAGSSIKQFGHYAYGRYYPGTFQQYRYSSEKKNLKLYNSTTPPEYPLENNNFPVAIYHGSNDFLAPPEDVAMLIKKLPNVVDNYLVPEPNLNHYDLIIGRNIRTLIYDRALEWMEKYN